MLSGVKKAAAAALQLTPSYDDDLSKAIQQEKYCADLLQKLLQARKQAIQHWSNWAEKEASHTVRLLVSKLTQVDSMWSAACADYLNQQETVRDYFKHIANGEKIVAGLREKAAASAIKASKANKQMHDMNTKYSNKTSDAKKLEQLTLDYGKAQSLQERDSKELQQKEINHEQFKFAKLRDGLKLMFLEQVSLTERCLQLSKGGLSILNEFTSVPYSRITHNTVKHANATAQEIINQLSSAGTKRFSKLEGLLLGQVKGASETPQTMEPQMPRELDVSRGHEFSDQPVYFGVPDDNLQEFDTPEYLDLQTPDNSPWSSQQDRELSLHHENVVRGHEMDDQHEYSYTDIPVKSNEPFYDEPPNESRVHSETNPSEKNPKIFDRSKPLPAEPDTNYGEVWSGTGSSVGTEPATTFEDDPSITYDNIHEAETTYENFEPRAPPLPEKHMKARKQTSLELAEQDMVREGRRSQSQRSSKTDSLHSHDTSEDEYENADDWNKKPGATKEQAPVYGKPWA